MIRYTYNIIKSDYLQRSRSYGFLVALAITVFAAYSFVPPPTANYTTLSMPGYIGVYNSAWVGYVSAMMTTIMASLCGFYLVNSGIKKDIDTEVGLIIATTPICNSEYLISKLLSNFLLLLTITGITFIVSVLMFFMRSAGYPFIISDFLLPYLFFAIPALFFVSALAVVSEVAFKRNQILPSIIFVFLFVFMIGQAEQMKNDNTAIFLDIFGIKTMTGNITNQVNAQFKDYVPGVSIGFTSHRPHEIFKTFTWSGISWTKVFIISRLLWIAVGCLLVYFSSYSFHRFDLKEQGTSKRKMKLVIPEKIHENVAPVALNINLLNLPKLNPNYGLAPLVKTELLLIIRQGPKWMWLLIMSLWVAMLFVPFTYAYSSFLPIIWFFQVSNWSDLATKEKTYRLHYFTFAAFNSLKRILPAQILAGIIFALFLALPIIVRSGLMLNLYAICNIVNGAIFIVLLAVCLGIMSNGKKLFEIIFFLITYIIIDKGAIVDYLGALTHDNHTSYIFKILLLNVILATTSLSVRKYQVRNL